MNKFKGIVLMIVCIISLLTLSSCGPKYGRSYLGGMYQSYYYFNSSYEHLEEIQNMTASQKYKNDLTDKSYYMIHLDIETEYIADMNSVIGESGKNKYTEIDNVSRRLMFFKPIDNIYGMSSIYIGLGNLELNSIKENISFVRTEPDERYVHSIDTLDEKRYTEFLDYYTDEVNGVIKEYKFRNTRMKYQPDSDFLIDMWQAQQEYWHLVSTWNIYYTDESGTVEIGLVEFCYNLGVAQIRDYSGEYFSNVGHSKMTQWVCDEVIEYENIYIDLMYKNLEIYIY